MKGISITSDGLLEVKSIPDVTKYIVHDRFDDIEMRSKWSIEECCENFDIIHSFKFPPPLNRYLVPKDVYFIKLNDADIKPSDIENICQKVYKKSIHVSIYEKQKKTEEEELDDEFDDDIEQEEYEDDENEDDEDDENEVDDDDIGWDDATDENIVDDISHKK